MNCPARQMVFHGCQGWIRAPGFWTVNRAELSASGVSATAQELDRRMQPLTWNSLSMALACRI